MLGNLAAYTNSSGTTTQPSTTVASGYTKQKYRFFFFRANYTFKDRLFICTVTGRSDGNYRFFCPRSPMGRYFPSGAFCVDRQQRRFYKEYLSDQFDLKYQG